MLGLLDRVGRCPSPCARGFRETSGDPSGRNGVAEVVGLSYRMGNVAMVLSLNTIVVLG